MTVQPITVNPDTSLSDVLYLLNRYQLSRLPVTEGSKLIGIITRSDIIRVEANQIQGDSQKVVKAASSYIVYQTRAPAVGKGRLLLPLSNPKTAHALFQIAAAIARYEDYEIECLNVIKIPKHHPPAETAVNIQDSRKLLQRIERLARHLKLPVHTQIRVSQSTSEAILETIRERHINLILTGWKGSTSTQGTIFGDSVDKLIQKAPCDLVLVKFGNREPTYPAQLAQDTTWLIPMAGGPNIQRAMELLPGMTSLYSRPNSPQLMLCKVYLPPSEAEADYTDLEETAQYLQEKVKKPTLPIPLCAPSVSDAVIQLAESAQCDVIVLGASREGLLQQTIYGNIPNAIAQEVDSTVILVRGAISPV